MSDDEKLTSPREAWRICWGNENPWPPGECSMILFGNYVIHLIENDATPTCWSSDNNSRGEIGILAIVVADENSFR